MGSKNRYLSIVMIIMMLVSALGGFAATDATIQISIDGHIIDLDQDPYVTGGRVLVPLRGVFEALDIHVDYNQTTGQVIAKDDQVEVLMNIGEDLVLVNGQVTGLDVGTVVVDQRTYVPIRFIAEAFGHFVDWDNENRTVIIETDGGEVFHNEALPVVSDRETLMALISYNDTMNGYISGPEIMFEALDMDESAPEAVTDSAGDSGTDDAKDYSDTNNQVAGVQESDVIKTDGDYIYQVVDGKVNIYTASPSNLQKIGTISDESRYIEEIFLADNKLVTYSRTYNVFIEPMPLMDVMTDMYIMPYYEDETYVNVYDVSVPASPAKVQSYKFDGNFVAGRVIGDNLYMSVSKYFWISPYWTLDEQAAVSDEQILPSYTNLMTGEEVMLQYEDIRYFPDQVSSQYFMTIGLALDSGAIDVDAYLGYGGQTYVSESGFYTAVTHYDYNVLESAGFLYQPVYDPSTVIYRFDIANGQFSYDTKGMVPGTVLNQFSMDEYDGNFRIATTVHDNWWWDNQNTSTNNLYILDGQLNQIGSIEGLAEGETIYSTRFVGEKIYMVTFRQVDPFFVIDASEPTNPQVLGFLKIPGFSTYMHPLDEHHIIGFGQETYENEWGGISTGGFKISLFDVTDFSNPVESDQIIIGKSGTYSELQYNHKALMYQASQGIMALPISVCDYVPYDADFVGAYVFDVDANDIAIRGRMTHHDGTTEIVDDWDYKYLDWSYNISRVLYIDGLLYAFSEGAITVHNLNTLEVLDRLVIE